MQGRYSETATEARRTPCPGGFRRRDGGIKREFSVEVTMVYYLAEKPYQFELVLVSPYGTSSNHTFPPGTSDMAKITTRKKKKDCVKKKKHRKAQNRDGRTYQKSEVETSLNTIYDLAIITVLYGEEVLKSQCQEMVDKEVAEWVKTA
ncbi:hypothetical protein POTOM_058048 [Populus tomentosa]|uniref:Uncharacterized protein n=1 Tax=Populus tomentosa TaxID=118781 RepID=A0A8X7Y3E8_POPTO|nr:hypothetical protein POTOM_058048 [Populus tomentosa]